MGVDIYSRSGVVVTVDHLVEIIRNDNRQQACQALLRHTAMLLHSLRKDGRNNDDVTHHAKRKQAALLVKAFKDLTVHTSVKDIRSMLKSLTRHKGRKLESYVVNSEEAIEIWGALISELFPNSPIPESTEYISAPRHQGYDLPQGEILFVFPEGKCFERVKTTAGKALDAMLNKETILSTWTEFSA